MNKEERIAKYGEAAYLKLLAQRDAWAKAHPEDRAAYHREYSKKGSKRYEKNLLYQRTGLRGERMKVRHKHGKLWGKYKRIIAPDSQIQHEWFPRTAEYRGVALVEADHHMHGIVDVIEVLEGEITLFTEKEIAEQKPEEYEKWLKGSITLLTEEEVRMRG